MKERGAFDRHGGVITIRLGDPILVRTGTGWACQLLNLDGPLAKQRAAARAAREDGISPTAADAGQ